MRLAPCPVATQSLPSRAHGPTQIIKLQEQTLEEQAKRFAGELDGYGASMKKTMKVCCGCPALRAAWLPVRAAWVLAAWLACALSTPAA